jgi:hypothetical protein
MRLLALTLSLCCGLSAQYVRRSVIPTTKPQDSTKGMVVTFYGKLTEFSKSDFTIATEDQPSFVIGKSHKTKFVKDGKPIKFDDIPIGAQLAVDVTKDADLHPLALTVEVDPKPDPNQKKTN